MFIHTFGSGVAKPYFCEIHRGQDSGSEVSLRQGFTHTFILTFKSAEDFAAYSGHPNHLQFAGTFAAAIENILVFDYPPNIVKPPLSA